MQWSKIKKKFEESLADKLKGRLDIHIAVYRKPKNSSRAVIYFDKEQIIEVSIPCSEDMNYKYPKNTRNFGEAIGDIINISINEAIGSEDVIIQGLAFLDKRMGKRRLLKINYPKLHPFAKTLFELRANCEGIRLKSPDQ